MRLKVKVVTIATTSRISDVSEKIYWISTMYMRMCLLNLNPGEIG